MLIHITFDKFDYMLVENKDRQIKIIDLCDLTISVTSRATRGQQLVTYLPHVSYVTPYTKPRIQINTDLCYLSHCKGCYFNLTVSAHQRQSCQPFDRALSHRNFFSLFMKTKMKTTALLISSQNNPNVHIVANSLPRRKDELIKTQSCAGFRNHQHGPPFETTWYSQAVRGL